MAFARILYKFYGEGVAVRSHKDKRKSLMQFTTVSIAVTVNYPYVFSI